MDIRSYQNITVTERPPRFEITRAHVAAAGFVAVAALVAGGVYAYLFLWPYADADHEAYLGPDTAIRFVFQPARAQRYVSRLAPSATRFVKGIPRLTSTQGGAIRIDWLHTLPREGTLLFAHATQEELAATLVVRPHPEAYDFAGLINDSGIFGDLGFAQWSPRRVAGQADGALVARGVARIPQQIQQNLADTRQAYTPIEPPAIEGDHLFELAVDNGNNILSEMQGILTAAYGGWGSPEIGETLRDLFPSVAACSVVGDLEGADRLVFALEVEAWPDADAVALERGVAEFADAVGRALGERHGFRFEETALEVSGGGIRGAYLLTGFEFALERALGG